ncbi:torsin-3A, partial [Sarcophilus harrisii]
TRRFLITETKVKVPPPPRHLAGCSLRGLLCPPGPGRSCPCSGSSWKGWGGRARQASPADAKCQSGLASRPLARRSQPDLPSPPGSGHPVCCPGNTNPRLTGSERAAQPAAEALRRVRKSPGLERTRPGGPSSAVPEGARGRPDPPGHPEMLSRGAALWLCLVLLLTEAAGEDARQTWWDRAAVPMAKKVGKGLKERVRAVTDLSKKYWDYFSCQVWSEHCDGKKDASKSLGWISPLLSQQYMDILSSWYCKFKDCCDRDDCRIINNITGLEIDLSTRLHGQHLVQEVVLKSIRGFLSMPQPEKPLVLSFNGWSGTGKNFVTRMLADQLYRDGLESECVQVFISMLHFPHLKYVDVYKEKLMEQVSDTVQRCGQALFVFDEAEKLPPNLLETLKPILDHYDTIKEVDYRRAIFIFLSNFGGNTINEVVLSWLKAGRSREEITMEDLEPHIQEILKSTDSNFGHNRLVKENLIDFFVPFLPLEYHHVKLCARDAFMSRDLEYTEEMLDKVAKMMMYVPKEEKLFSAQGCKSISQRINFFLP